VPAMGQAAPLFSGDYTVDNWSFSTNGGEGYVDTSGAPNYVELFGSDNGIGDVTDAFLFDANYNDTVTFNWWYETFDVDGAEFDPFGYILDETFYQLTDSAGDDVQSGSATVTLTGGTNFGFAIWTEDGLFGRAHAIIGDVSQQPVPAPATLALMGLGLAGVMVSRRRKKA